MVNPRVFLDFQVEGQPIGRVIFELFADEVPKTTENFRALCTGSKGVSETSGSALWYKGSPMHRIIAGFMVQGGDFIQRNGKGGESIYGATFADESLKREIDAEGLLCMANRGKNTNGSQFFVSLRPCPHLAGKHVVMGRVVKGHEVIAAMSKLPTDAKDHPLQLVTIAHCGELERKAPAKPAPPPSPSVASSRSRSASVSSRGRSRSPTPSRLDRSASRSRSRSVSPVRKRSKTSRSSRHRAGDESDDERPSNRRHKSSRRKHRSLRRDRSGDRKNKDRSSSPELTAEQIAELEKQAAAEAAAAIKAKEEEARLAEERRKEAAERKKRMEEEQIARGGVILKGRGRMKAPDYEHSGGMRGW
ncbi:hypothetical protein JCM11641_003873 [Rhodosporidiobolus odoratus]